MSTVFVDRESAYPNRYRVIPESGNAYYAILERDDEPVTPGTPLNAETFNGMRDEIDASLAKTVEYTKKVGNPRNLLDNSDFRNPVNQRGAKVYTFENKLIYTIDRWHIAAEGTVTVEDGYISKIGSMAQAIFGLDKSKTYTAAVCSKDGVVSTLCGTIINTKGIGSWYDNVFVYASEEREDITIFAIPDRGPSEIIWAALYEGEYTAETLPEYQPKGYGAELAECQRYYIKYPYLLTTGYVTTGSTDYYIPVWTPVKMRVIPSVEGTPKWRGRISSGGYSAYTGKEYKAFTAASILNPADGLENCYVVKDTLPASAGDTNNSMMLYDVQNLELNADL